MTCSDMADVQYVAKSAKNLSGGIKRYELYKAGVSIRHKEKGINNKYNDRLFIYG